MLKLTKPMIDGAKLKPPLERIGYYRSGIGGARKALVIPANVVFFELITEGAVYAPDSNDLHGAGAIFVHHPGQSTICRSPSQGYYACMTARFQLDRLPRRFAWPRVFQWSDANEALRFSQEVLYAFHHADVDQGVLGDLIWSQFRFRLEEFLRMTKHRAMPPLVAEVISHLDRHYAEPLGVEDLAAHFGLSASHLHAQFREHAGMTPHQHLILQRMRSARHKLVTTNDPIKSIAQEVGYANAENFCRAFKKHSGLTAAAYRSKFIPHG